MNTGEIKSDLEQLDPVVDVRVWREAVATRSRRGRKTVRGGDVTKISVEAKPADTTAFLTDVMKEHRLVITEAKCGAEGLIADLRSVEAFLDVVEED